MLLYFKKLIKNIETDETEWKRKSYCFYENWMNALEKLGKDKLL